MVNKYQKKKQKIFKKKHVKSTKFILEIKKKVKKGLRRT